MSISETPSTHCGFVAIVGRPNVGKSTLLNYFLGKKISITADKPQTTRHRILGIKTNDDCQMIFIDTPGLHRVEKRAINRSMNKAVLDAIPGADTVLFILEAGRYTGEDQWVAAQISKHKIPMMIAINKIDLMADRNLLLPFLKELSELFPDVPLLPISALEGDNMPHLLDVIKNQLPQDHFYFPTDQVTDRSDRFMASELIREKIMRFLGEEVPYSTAVMIDQFEITEKIINIAATILVERKGQKAIMIGRKGVRLKQIGQAARYNMERLFGQKVYLNLWVKVKSGWSDDERALKSLGYDENE